MALGELCNLLGVDDNDALADAVKAFHQGNADLHRQLEAFESGSAALQDEIADLPDQLDDVQDDLDDTPGTSCDGHARRDGLSIPIPT